MTIVIKKYGFLFFRYKYTVYLDGKVYSVGDVSSLVDIFEGKLYKKVIFI